ncbi:hypothetical protein CYMTET_26220 [Cymbomonas tetramitiformis]|uniref:beta-galactoside alpha-(2,6)-sialyltransferase n=1 Tax=Cymbomonas tetramitiformis TaxID=36881 RepID=A0AAE0FSS7_9CHLO|nr:hypothetical protein CYMTET_26220 [Cymbomonas tetramitiformis]
MKSPKAKRSQRRRYYWPLINLAVIFVILSRRINNEVESEPIEPSPIPKCQDLEEFTPCPNDCSDHGQCFRGNCSCEPAWTGPSCSERTCPKDCSGHGTCMPEKICLCKRDYAGEDCSIEVAELNIRTAMERAGAPFLEGRFEDDVELMMGSHSGKKYAKHLCRTQACASQWELQVAQLAGFLPREDLRSQYHTCAVVSSAKSMVPKAKRGSEGFGVDIDKHPMILRLDNAPTAGFEKWVGSRTTHRLVQHDYARLVHSMLGTEIVVNQTKGVVTPSTWWHGGYPSVEKVTYLMAVPAQASKQQMRPQDHATYAPFSEVFPGQKRFLISPMFLKRVAEAHKRVQEVVRTTGMGCYKDNDPKVPTLLLAALLSLQMCDKVVLYGVNVGAESAHASKVYRDKKFRIRTRHGSDTECCYYPHEEGYSPETPLCDDLTRRHALRFLLETGRENGAMKAIDKPGKWEDEVGK